MFGSGSFLQGNRMRISIAVLAVLFLVLNKIEATVSTGHSHTGIVTYPYMVSLRASLDANQPRAETKEEYVAINTNIGGNSETLPSASSEASGGEESLLCEKLVDDLVDGQEQKTAKHLVLAIIDVESRCDNSRRGRVGEIGFMQIRPTTARMIGCGDITDPLENIRCGVRYIQYLQLVHNKVELVELLRAYNGGPGVRRNNAMALEYAEKVVARFRARLMGTS